jgi:predicted nucleic acid-binding protein
LGTSNNIELCLVIPQETLQPLKEQVTKALKQKELGKRKMETFTSKVIDLMQLKL